MFGFFKKRRRERIRNKPFPDTWRRMIERNMAAFERMSPEDQEELAEHVQVFLAEKCFEGCGGMEITDEVRLVIAAHACRLLMHRETDYFPRLTSVLVYPSSFVVNLKERGPEETVTEGEEVRVGEAWQHGAVILAWDDVLNSAQEPGDGHNVVLHEFAHVLDMENGDADGVPELEDAESGAHWGEVCSAAFERLQRNLDWGRPVFIDAYAAKSPAEFFAVTTEYFFETPARLQRHYPELYEVLREYYCQDPAGRSE
jgi:hypothetical protein